MVVRLATYEAGSPGHVVAGTNGPPAPRLPNPVSPAEQSQKTRGFLPLLTMEHSVTKSLSKTQGWGLWTVVLAQKAHLSPRGKRPVAAPFAPRNWLVFALSADYYDRGKVFLPIFRRRGGWDASHAN